MLRRDAMTDLISWKNDPSHKPLMVNGVRQCGKTFLIKQFGREQYQDVAYFNFEEDDVSAIFDRDLKVDRIVETLGIHRSKRITEDTLIIFDEIQICPRAITSLKYFCESETRYDVIAAGSLLGVKITDSSVPVGKIDDLDMRPLSFREFLLANDEELIADMIGKNPFSEDIQLFGDRLERCYRQYLAFGGLPEVVSEWVTNHDVDTADRLLRSLTKRYIDDINKHAEGSVRRNGETVWRSVPAQLARDNGRFVFGHVSEGLRARDLWRSVDWLERAGLIRTVHICKRIELPLSFGSDPSAMKIYCFDTGVLRTLSGLPAETILEDSDNYSGFKGAVTENYVLNEMTCIFDDDETYCWHSNRNAEVDFVRIIGSRIIPIEVKAGTKTVTKSLTIFMDRFGTVPGVIVSKNPPKMTENTVHMQLYQVWALEKMIGTYLEKNGHVQSDDAS